MNRQFTKKEKKKRGKENSIHGKRRLTLLVAKKKKQGSRFKKTIRYISWSRKLTFFYAFSFGVFKIMLSVLARVEWARHSYPSTEGVNCYNLSR